jgi:hypothetical protein
MLVVAISASLVAAACGGDDSGSSSPTTAAAGSRSNAEEPGEASSGAVGVGLPVGADEDFPIAIPDGWVIDFYEELGLTVAGTVQVFYPADDFDEIVTFYSDWTNRQADEYARIDTGDTVVFQAGSPIRRIAISGNYDEGGERYTMVQAAASSG